MTTNERIDYIELAATDIEAAKAFYGQVFGWIFVDYGPEYSSFKEHRFNGGLTSTRKPAAVGEGALVVFHAADIEVAQAAVEAAGGTVSTPIFEFPGGRRFQFTDPSGNELAIWTE
jgi:predicted enzyme related to lactoylglutathione lyase